MQKEKLSREEFLWMFREDVIRLSRYIPWLEKKSGTDVYKFYQDGDKMQHTMTFPVYDSILLSFLNDASMTVFMEQNYHYFYAKHRIRNYEDELRLIEQADIMHMENLQCILSKYVFGGMTKAYLWKDGVEHRIFLNILKKARKIVEFWDQPLVIEDAILPEEAVEEIAEEIPEEPVEEIAEEIPEEAVEEIAEEISEEAVEEIAEEISEEAVEEAAGEMPEEAVEEVAEEIPEEPIEEAAEEIPEELIEEAAEEIPEEPIEEAAEEIPEEPIEEVAEEIPEEPAEEVQEETAEETVEFIEKSGEETE
jgi:histone H3/H4